MNPIFNQIFSDGIIRYYPYKESKLIIRIFQSFVIYYIDSMPNSTHLEFIVKNNDGLNSFNFDGYYIPLCYSLPYNAK